MSSLKKKKKPRFKRQYYAKKRVQRTGWRRPRGEYSKQAMKIRGKGYVPNVGYGTPRKLKHLHPSGYQEVLIMNLTDLTDLDPNRFAIRISSVLGERKRKIIIEKAKAMKLKILNE